MTEPRFEGYELVRRLRTGPATDWYLARHASLRRSVVIKSLGSHLSPDSPFGAPLEREAHLLGRLQHEHIVQLYDFEKHGAEMWLVLEYVDGWTLEELLQEVQRLPVAAALAVARSLASALVHVHTASVVHRDVRPRNVLISKQGHVKLSNFYLAAEEGSPPPPEPLEGDSGFPDLSYMSPEQILGERADARSDLFSVGVVLYEMLSGRRPFEAKDHRTTAQRIRHEPPSPLGDDIVGLTPLVERILQRTLSKLASDRYSDAQEFLAELDRALAEFGRSPSEALLAGLSEAHLVEGRASRVSLPKKRRGARPVARALWVYAACLVAFLAGTVVINRVFARTDRIRLDQTPELRLAPQGAGYLNAVVRPWAHVFVDGQQVETTPFAHPIPLSPGVHYLRFEHPSSAPVPRRIEILPGQKLLLEIDMPLARSDPAEDVLERMLQPPVQRDAGRSP